MSSLCGTVAVNTPPRPAGPLAPQALSSYFSFYLKIRGGPRGVLPVYDLKSNGKDLACKICGKVPARVPSVRRRQSAALPAALKKQKPFLRKARPHSGSAEIHGGAATHFRYRQHSIYFTYHTGRSPKSQDDSQCGSLVRSGALSAISPPPQRLKRASKTAVFDALSAKISRFTGGAGFLPS